jgi:peptidoglycan/LPS O-acetylase OafA/YrhL
VPPYYAALAFSLAVLWCVPALTIKLRYAADLSPANLTAHALLVNNLGPPNWQYGINYPLWTIPLEFQLYATFPVLALALARLGPAWALATAVALTTGARYLVAHGLLPAPLSMSVPGYLGVFVAGMAAAALYERPGLPRWALGAGALALVASGVASWHTRASFVAADELFGLGFAALVLWLGGRAPVVPRPLVGLGRMSYSLYLIHAMLLGLWRMGVAPLHFTPPVYLALTVFVGVPGIVAVAYAFHLAVERPFLGRPPMLAPKPVQEAA